MAWMYTSAAVDSTGSSFTNSRYTIFDYGPSTTTATTTNSYFDQVTNSTYYTGGTGDDYFNREYFTIPFQTPIRIEEQPRSQPSPPVSQPAPSPPVPSQPPRPGPEEIEAREKARKQEIDAQEKARKLLLEYLDQDNKQKYLEKKPIEVVSRLFNDIRYQIPISKLDKILALKDDKIVSKLCLVVKEPEQIPLEDVILTKLLYILRDEEFALRTANHSIIQENLLDRLN